MTQDEAETIAGWSYEPPYDFYDAHADEADRVELLTAGGRGDRYFSARDARGELVGSFVFEREGDVVIIGLGLRPDLTGRGLGSSFVEAGVDFARERFAPRRLSLSVADFNVRAITVYERAGFVRTRSFLHETNGGTFSFVEMQRPA
ncbi:MAG: GNAT family N-acetyltransferase [Gaiellaceae bacterium]